MPKKKNNKREREVQELVIARLETTPSDTKISIGSNQELTRDELIKHVKGRDKIGKKITEVQLSYLQSLKEGPFYEQNSTNNQTKV